MRTQRQSGGARRARGRASLRAALALPAALVLALLLAASAGAQPPTRNACDAPVQPGRARCLAERLLVEQAAAQPFAAPRAGGTAISSSKPFPGFQTPQRLRELYELPEETAAGSTQTVAVVDAFDDPTAEADLEVFSKQFGLPACTAANGCFKKVNQKGQSAPLPPVDGGWASEISIDVQMAHAICQSCHIVLVEAKTEEFSDLGAGVNAAVSLGATEVSNSYGSAEEAGEKELESGSYNHPGVVITASSGDCGYLNRGCPEEVQEGTEFPADSPHVVAVGGTSVHESGGVWTSTVWKDGGSGCSVVFSAPFWESGIAGFAATGCASGRSVADVAAVGDPNTGVDVYDSTPEFTGGPTGWGVWGGTSVAAPIVAAEFALAGGAQGVSYPAATLYAHAAEAGDFYDVTSGTNGTCGGATICKATAGYDGPTGIGSPVGLEGFAVNGVPESTSPPTISGYPEQEQTLSEQHGGWTGEPTTFSYQWERCGPGGTGCQTIPGATGESYKLTAADVAQTVRVRESARNALGTGSADSAATGQVASDVPLLTGFTPTSGITGSTIVVQGSALDSTTGVLVGKLPAAFTVVSPSELEVVVPNGEKKGNVTVTTAHGSAAARVKFVSTLAVTGFSPKSAIAGTLVTIKGVGFAPGATVSFGGVPAANVTYYSPKKLRAAIPPGAGDGPVTVTNTSPAGTVASAETFTP